MFKRLTCLLLGHTGDQWAQQAQTLFAAQGWETLHFNMYGISYDETSSNTLTPPFGTGTKMSFRFSICTRCGAVYAGKATP